MTMIKHPAGDVGGRAVPAKRPPQGSGRGRTVLIVEDSDVIRRVLALILEAEGYRVVESPSGEQVAALALGERPDLITLDLSLPDVDGRELLRSLGTDQTLRAVPVVVISAFADTLTSNDLAHAVDVIVKPFDLDDLLLRLERAVSGRATQGAGAAGRGGR
jgi:CheY-like chemotaxis protein